jgi:hypothetical protein
MKKRILILTVTISAFIITGCSSLAIKSYITPNDNLNKMAEYSKYKYKIKVGRFTSNLKNNRKFSCRAVTLKVPDNLTFQEYFRKSMINEFQFGGIYSHNANIEIKGNINAIKLDTPLMVGKAKWDLDVDIYINEKDKFNIKSTYNFPSSFNGMQACKNSSYYFVKAVQDLINKILVHEHFKKHFAKYRQKNRTIELAKKSTLIIDKNLNIDTLNGRSIDIKLYEKSIMYLKPGVYYLGGVYYSDGRKYTKSKNFKVKLEAEKITFLSYKKDSDQLIYQLKKLDKMPDDVK